jgi:DNA-binding NarL/FixJ family response regulator
MNDKIIIQNGDKTVELTGEEKQQFLAYQESIQSHIEAQQAEQEAKLAARESALQKLAALGLTEDEIAAL